MKRKSFALLMVLILIAAAVIVATPKANAAEHSNHCLCGDGKADELPESNHTCAPTTEWTAWTKTDSLPTTDGNYYLTGNVTLSAVAEYVGGTGKALNICLNGYTVTGPATGGVIDVTGNFFTLGICDCSAEETGKIVALNTEGCYKYDAWGGQAINVNAQDGVLNLYSGTITMSKDAKEYGLAGLISFEMNLTAGTNSNVQSNQFGNRNKVYLYNAVITGGKAQTGANLCFRFFRNGKFYMYGGEVSNGSAVDTGNATVTTGQGFGSDPDSKTYGGNIYLSYYDINLYIYGGKIVDGKTETGNGQHGGNICVFGGGSHVYLYKDAVVSGGKSHYGGNISIRSGHLHVEGGSILNGTATSYGGNVSLGSTRKVAYLYMNGGVIAGGQANMDGGGVYGQIIDSNKCGEVQVKGAAQIFGNISAGAANDVDMRGMSAFKVTGALTDGAKIGLNGQSNETISSSTGLAENTGKYFFLNGSDKVASVVGGKLTVVNATDEGSLQAAIDAGLEEITLKGNVTASAKLAKNVKIVNGDYAVALDLNGFDATVTGTGLVTAINSSYTDAAVKQSTNVTTGIIRLNKIRSVTKKVGDDFVVSRFYVGATNVYLNAAKETLSIGITVKGAAVTARGVILSIAGVDGEHEIELQNETSVVTLKNFFENNAQDAKITVKAYAMVDGQKIVSDAYTLSFGEVIEDAYAKIAELTPEQAELVEDLYAKYAPVTEE